MEREEYILATNIIFQKLTKDYNCPQGVKSPNLVTLPEKDAMQLLSLGAYMILNVVMTWWRGAMVIAKASDHKIVGSNFARVEGYCVCV
jgi:hypothetical protein